ncbi:thioesterase family protein [Rhodococcus fascians]|nr:thioesterase family protein [Rhodococcus fascians]MBY4238692.1 thioesterase family protein [Rhodococcus fascians]MBY4254719.1 thioesterase family protein [Rhodococcus fascians]MBY4270047.1 thioesterase family protein [Rhodococcus fascians]
MGDALTYGDDEFGDDTSIEGVANSQELVHRLAVEPWGSFEGPPHVASSFTGWPVRGFAQRTFGGHLAAQAVLACAATVRDESRVVNSLHAYFLSSGSHEHPIRYDVNAVRDGRSFSIRETKVSQNGRDLARVSTSFCPPEAIGNLADAQSATAPTVPSPEKLEPLHRRRLLGLPPDGIKLPTRRRWDTASRPIDIRYIDGGESRCFWFRTAAVDDAHQNVHRSILAFASDRSLLPVIAYARGDIGAAHLMRTASIDHAMWFHADVLSGHWYLYVQDSPFRTLHSGLARGSIFDRTGHVVATVTQQGLIVGDRSK